MDKIQLLKSAEKNQVGQEVIRAYFVRWVLRLPPTLGHRWQVKKSWARAYHMSAQGTYAISITIL